MSRRLSLRDVDVILPRFDGVWPRPDKVKRQALRDLLEATRKALEGKRNADAE